MPVSEPWCSVAAAVPESLAGRAGLPVPLCVTLSRSWPLSEPVSLHVNLGPALGWKGWKVPDRDKKQLRPRAPLLKEFIYLFVTEREREHK